ncbi:MAG TPA: DEAD/DEAH box helicase [Spirochaetia bacterium]|nr:DEAD/DEAH box helicase [Spirochaetia bacterium]
MKFSELPLSEEVSLGVKDAGFTDCTDVQELTLTYTLQGRDVCVQSQTGTGKTAAYLLSVFQLMTHRDDLAGRMTMIIAPTRELAVQIEQEALLLGKHVPLRIGCFYGGVGYADQEQKLAAGVDVAIGTPGRLIDFNQSGKLDFSKVGIVIIDEADRLFDMGFYPDIRKMLKRMPPREQRISMLFSATLSTRARNIAWEHMNNPAEVEIHPEQVTVKGITQALYHVARDEKFRLLLGLLGKFQPENAIIFTNTKRAAEEISRRLELNGHESTFIMGDLPQRKRLRVIEGIKAGTVKLLVATDVAARGLHIDDLDMVINYDLPEDRESYVHRIGRTARAGKTGRAISLADERFVFGLEAIEEFIGYPIPVERVTDELIVQDASAGKRISIGRDSEMSGPRGRGTRRNGPGRQSEHGGPRSRRPYRSEPEGQFSGGGQRQMRDDRPRPEKAAKPAGEGKSDLPKRTESPDVARSRPDKRTTVEERLDYYRKKYGEEFSVGKPAREKVPAVTHKPRERRPDDKQPGHKQAPVGKKNRTVPAGDRVSRTPERSEVADPQPASTEKSRKSAGQPAAGSLGILGRIRRLFGRAES